MSNKQRKRFIPIEERETNVWAELNRIETHFGRETVVMFSKDIYNNYNQPFGYRPEVVDQAQYTNDLMEKTLNPPIDSIQVIFDEYLPSGPVSSPNVKDAIRVALGKLRPGLKLPVQVSWTHKGKKQVRNVVDFLSDVKGYLSGDLMDIPPDFEIVTFNFVKACNRVGKPK